MITKKELIDALADFAQDDVIIIAADSEGNGFSALDSIEGCYFRPSAGGHQALGECLPKLRKIPAGTVLSAICLWPSH